MSNLFSPDVVDPDGGERSSARLREGRHRGAGAQTAALIEAKVVELLAFEPELAR